MFCCTGSLFSPHNAYINTATDISTQYRSIVSVSQMCTGNIFSDSQISCKANSSYLCTHRYKGGNTRAGHILEFLEFLVAVVLRGSGAW